MAWGLLGPRRLEQGWGGQHFPKAGGWGVWTEDTLLRSKNSGLCALTERGRAGGVLHLALTC